MIELFNLKKQFTFYNKYHSNNCNKLIHYICIPSLVFSLFIFLNYIPYEYKFNYLHQYTLNDITFNLAYSNTIFANTTLDNIFLINTTYILLIIYIIYYLILDILVGLISLIFYGFISIYSVYLVYNFNDTSWLLGILLHILSWLFQILGHYICEKNKPAICDSLIKSFLIAPFFVIFDLLRCCNYKKNVIEDKPLSEMLF